ncbi:MAG: DUF1015 family protein [Spirochaetes bacterium]|jgi:hypothetical protein|nr:DUF1015 family protein [Spirochaetota bacterium]
MSDATERLKSLGILVPEILLPRGGVELSKWATIACDQHTSNPDYWREVERRAYEAPSTLNLVFPEVYLEDGDIDARISSIRTNMESYLADGVLEPHGPLAVFTKRFTRGEQPRRGLVVAIDLERYDYAPGSTSLIRASEETILSRLPVRERIRAGAPLELPHVMLLLDDPDNTVFGALESLSETLRPLYDTELMLGGGHIRGYAIEDEPALAAMAAHLEVLADPVQLACRYGSDDELLLAVGDGNHSLAAAKGVWEREKAGGADPQTHPGRYALVEIVNLYDPALTIEPIHRILFGADADRVQAALRSIADDSWEEAGNAATAIERTRGTADGFCFIHAGGAAVFTAAGDDTALPQERVEAEIERLRQGNEDISVDYIHGTEELVRIAEGEGRAGIVMPGLERELLFPRVVTSGPLPRKMFSMGESFEKRYYLEARRIR